MSALRLWTFAMWGFGASVVLGAPVGFVKSTILLNAPPVSLAFDPNGVLYALENAAFMTNQATLRTILADGTFGSSFPITGEASDTFFAGGMAYDAFDSLNERLLITDNAGDGWLYEVDLTGTRDILVDGIAGIADVAVRSTGEIFVSTAPFGEPGAVWQVDRATGAKTAVITGLGFGAGLEFDLAGNLIVQDVNSDTFAARLRRFPVTETPGGITIGPAEPILDGMSSGYGLAIDGEGDIFTTGSGGLFRIEGEPLAEIFFDSDGSEFPFSGAIAFDPDSLPFEGFSGADGGRLVYTASAFSDTFITVITPAERGDYNLDGDVDAEDYARWQREFGTAGPGADGSGDGVVDAADYVVWQKLMQSGSGASAAAPGQAPEPATWLVVAAISGLLAGRRCGRGSW